MAKIRWACDRLWPNSVFGIALGGNHVPDAQQMRQADGLDDFGRP